ncbi:SLBB domain-containing protein [Candidatus Poribacteria bacterium]|nr:SLBB domain-containing protein [Candidatus Poribacteria bacterium]
MKLKLSLNIIFTFLFVNLCAGEYRIGVDDVLSISVWNHPEMSISAVRVRPDGKISLPVVGDVQAAGYTPAELQREISTVLRRYLRGEPIVTVTVTQFNSLKVSVFGAVVNPGSYTFVEPPTPLELIAKAGGMTQNADPSSARIVSSDGISTTVDLSKAILSGGGLPKLKAGDALFIPSSRRPLSRKDAGKIVRITILGGVRSPGTYEFPKTPTLVEAISKAGWVNSESSLEKVKVIRTIAGRSESVSVNVREFLEKGDPSLLPALESGDLVLVPTSKEEITILGGVNNPGTYPIIGQITILEAIGMAGGLSEKSDPRAVKIGRKKGGNYVWSNVDVTPWINGRSSSGNPPPTVIPGDLIIVPVRRFSFWSAAGTLRAVIAFVVDLIAVYGVYQLATR